MGKRRSKNAKLPAGVFVSTFVGLLLARLGPILSPTTPIGTVVQAFSLALVVALSAAGVARAAMYVL